MFAVIRLQGKQYLVSKGDVIEVSKMDTKKDDLIDIDDVLLYNNDKEIFVGQPRVKDMKVTALVLDPLKKGDKVDILTYKAKKRYIKRKGFRPQLTVLEIKDIVAK